MEEEVDQDRQRFAYFWTHHVRPLLEDALGKARVPDGDAFQAYPYLYMYVPVSRTISVSIFTFTSALRGDATKFNYTFS
jgi:hypothetical protein